MKNFTKFRQELVRTENAYDDACDELAAALQVRDTHASFDAQAVHRKISELQVALGDANSERQRQITAASRAERQAEKLDAKIGSRANPRNWFSSAQSELRASRRRSAAAQQRHEEAADKAHDTHKRTLKEIQDLQAQIQAHASLRAEDLEEACRAAQAKVDSLKVTVDDLDERYEAFTRGMSRVLQSHNDKGHKIRALQRHITKAEAMDRELSALPPGSSAKKDILAECKRLFGKSSPRAVIAAANKDIARLERGEAKLARRIDSGARRAHRTIKRVVIDGNNMCYYNMLEKPFIGLIALKSLLPEIADRYDVQVIFDGSIRGLLRADDHAIGKQLPRNVRVHITANRQAADDLFLRLVRDDPTAYIVTNDNLEDFPDQEAATQRRMSFELMDDRILVLDLDAEAAYGHILKDPEEAPQSEKS